MYLQSGIGTGGVVKEYVLAYHILPIISHASTKARLTACTEKERSFEPSITQNQKWLILPVCQWAINVTTPFF